MKFPKADLQLMGHPSIRWLRSADSADGRSVFRRDVENGRNRFDAGPFRTGHHRPKLRKLHHSAGDRERTLAKRTIRKAMRINVRMKTKSATYNSTLRDSHVSQPEPTWCCTGN